MNRVGPTMYSRNLARVASGVIISTSFELVISTAVAAAWLRLRRIFRLSYEPVDGAIHCTFSVAVRNCLGSVHASFEHFELKLR
jgi:hypothetical protein